MYMIRQNFPFSKQYRMVMVWCHAMFVTVNVCSHMHSCPISVSTTITVKPKSITNSTMIFNPLLTAKPTTI